MTNSDSPAETASENPPTIDVAIVGSGPSGYYAAAALLKSDQVEARVDVFDRLPTPFGLVRGGVAPDHQKIKNVTRVYERTASDERCRFFGNVRVGSDVALSELQAAYHAVILAVGNESDRKLGIDGEDLDGVHSATEFVGWYNGHPDFQDREFDFASAKRVAVVGNGNVAMDVARILARAPEDLVSTDITQRALDALESSNVEEVVVLGRRGPAQAAFSPKEIKEIGTLDNVHLLIDPDDMEMSAEIEAWLENEPRSSLKNVEYLREVAGAPQEGDTTVHCRFLVSPTAFHGEGGQLTRVTIEHNELYMDDSGTPRPRGTGSTEELDVDLVFKAVGYRGVPLEGAPFDDWRGIVPNREGRVVESDDGAHVPGLYVVGWAKRGPSGLIGTNGPDSQATVAMVLEDAPSGLPEPSSSPDALLAELRDRGVFVTDFNDWRRLDGEEVRRGEDKGKVREKICRVDEMLDVIRELRSSTVGD